MPVGTSLAVQTIMNAIELLKAQHKKVKTALGKAHAKGATSAELKQIADELVAHMVIEEHIFYPRIKELMKDMISESFEEHELVTADADLRA